MVVGCIWAEGMYGRFRIPVVFNNSKAVKNLEEKHGIRTVSKRYHHTKEKLTVVNTIPTVRAPPKLPSTQVAVSHKTAGVARGGDSVDENGITG